MRIIFSINTTPCSVHDLSDLWASLTDSKPLKVDLPTHALYHISWSYTLLKALWPFFCFHEFLNYSIEQRPLSFFLFIEFLRCGICIICNKFLFLKCALGSHFSLSVGELYSCMPLRGMLEKAAVLHCLNNRSLCM